MVTGTRATRAQYGMLCSACGRDIERGDLITFLDEEWCHTDCVVPAGLW